jgi:hypothetical protein
VDDVAPPSTALAFVTKISEKCKSTSLSEIQLKNWQKTISTEEKLNKSLTYAITDLLTAVHLQFMIMLTEL